LFIGQVESLTSRIIYLDEAITPALSLMWAGEANAQQAMDQAVKEGQKLLQGRLFKK
jgi:hypothetical protein